MVELNYAIDANVLASERRLLLKITATSAV